MQLTIDLCREVSPGAGRYGCLGRAADGARWVWLSRAGAAAGTEAETGTEAVFAVGDVEPESALAAVRYWHAWRVVLAASLEIGSRLLVVGDDETAMDILSLALMKGCLWRACLGSPHAAHKADHIVSAVSELDSLPARPDAVVITAQGADAIGLATRVCADRGTVVAAGVTAASIDLGFYPDVHRRGLKLVVLGSSSGDRADAKAFARLVRLVELRLIAADT